MNIFAVSALGTLATAFILIPNAFITKLDADTAAQCASHAWPAAQHAAHIEWCNRNGYITR